MAFNLSRDNNSFGVTFRTALRRVDGVSSAVFPVFGGMTNSWAFSHSRRRSLRDTAAVGACSVRWSSNRGFHFNSLAWRWSSLPSSGPVAFVDRLHGTQAEHYISFTPLLGLRRFPLAAPQSSGHGRAGCLPRLLSWLFAGVCCIRGHLVLTCGVHSARVQREPYPVFPQKYFANKNSDINPQKSADVRRSFCKGTCCRSCFFR